MPSLLPEAVLDYLAAYQTGDTSKLHLCLAPKVLYLNVTGEGGLRTEGIDGVLDVVRGVHDMLSDIKLTVTEQHVDGDIVRIAGFVDATSQKTITGGFQHGQHVHLPIRLAIEIEDGRIVKLFESS
jgi:predicted ester cyclase